MRDKRWSKGKGVGLLLVVFLLLLLNIGIGSVNIPLGDIVDILCGGQKGSTYAEIVMQIRFPRAVAAMLLGGALALSGYLLQTFFHNPIAGPFVLGISSGAKLCVALVMVGCLKWSITIGSIYLIGAAFAGAMLSMGFVLILSKSLQQMSMLIVSGVMISYICSAITEFVVTFADDSNIVNLHNWSQGSFSGTTWENVWCMLLVVGVTSVGVLFLGKAIGAFEMGEHYAQTMGVNVRRFRVLLVVVSSLLSACVTAFAGPISFVGIAVPHLIRQLFQTARPFVLIPGCFLGGAAFCLLCDLLARVVLAPTELSISTMTAVFGAPIVIGIMVKRKGGRL